MKHQIFYHGNYLTGIHKLSRYVPDCKTISVFTSHSNEKSADAISEFLKLPHRTFDVIEHEFIESNPSWDTMWRARKEVIHNKPDLIIGIGGGSVLDVAKFASSGAARSVPMIAIPTTMGTGSESTRYAVATSFKDGEIEKKTYEVKKPEYYILDPSLVRSLPQHVIASSGLDALTQAIEAYWSIHSNWVSDFYAKKAIKLSLKYLHKYYLWADKPKAHEVLDKNWQYGAPANLERMARKLMLAANYSGRAIEIAKTTVCHSLSYPMTCYYNIPHGIAAASTVHQFLSWNFWVDEKDCNDKRGVRYVSRKIAKLARIISGRGHKGFERLNAEVKLRSLFRSLAGPHHVVLKDIDIERVVHFGLTPSRAGNNPREVDEKTARVILASIKAKSENYDRSKA